jgi:hypothetical protein
MFGQKTELPDELKALNLSPAQILEAVNNGKAATDKVKALEGEVGTLRQTLETNTGEFRSLKEKLDNIEANPTRVDNNNNNEPTKTSFLTDEDKAFDERFIKSAGPLAMAAAQANAKAAKLLAKSTLQGQTITTSNGVISLAKLWDKWSADIDKEAKGVQLPYLGDENTWLRIFNLVKANHLEELMTKPETFIEPVGTGVNVRVGDAPAPDKLNDEQTSIMNKMARYGKGVTVESVLAQRKKMNFVGDNV